MYSDKIQNNQAPSNYSQLNDTRTNIQNNKKEKTNKEVKLHHQAVHDFFFPAVMNGRILKENGPVIYCD